MIAYLDSSVLLRRLLGQPDALAEWDAITQPLGSTLVEVECLRTLDRLRLRRALSDEALAQQREAVYRLRGSIELVELTRAVLNRAAQPMPTPLGTLDAIHLATAMMWGEHSGSSLVMATHDAGLGRAARAIGLGVIGV